MNNDIVASFGFRIAGGDTAVGAFAGAGKGGAFGGGENAKGMEGGEPAFVEEDVLVEADEGLAFREVDFGRGCDRVFVTVVTTTGTFAASPSLRAWKSHMGLDLEVEATAFLGS
jgi:hypothetical protein